MNKSKTPEQIQYELLKDLYAVECAFSQLTETEHSISKELKNSEILTTQLSQLNTFSTAISKTKLQPSIVSMVSGIEGLEQIMNINLSEIDNTNRNQMTQIATEGIGSTIKHSTDWLVKKIKAIATKIRNYMASTISVWARMDQALLKIEHFISNEIAHYTYDDVVFSAKKFKGYNYSDFKTLMKNTETSIDEYGRMVKNIDKGVYRYNTSSFAGMGIKLEELNSFGPEKLTEIVIDKTNKFPRTKMTMNEHGWTPKLVFSFFKQCQELVKRADSVADAGFDIEDKWLNTKWYANTSILDNKEYEQFHKTMAIVEANMNGGFNLICSIYNRIKLLISQFIQMFNAIKFNKKSHFA